ncbi:hypothetical protein Bpfe_023464, partial [Biomphalaria pfeifferi]
FLPHPSVFPSLVLLVSCGPDMEASPARGGHVVVALSQGTEITEHKSKTL